MKTSSLVIDSAKVLKHFVSLLVIESAGIFRSPNVTGGVFDSITDIDHTFEFDTQRLDNFTQVNSKSQSFPDEQPGQNPASRETIVGRIAQRIADAGTGSVSVICSMPSPHDRKKTPPGKYHQITGRRAGLQ